MELDGTDLTGEELWNRVQGLQAMLDEMGPITAGTELSLDGLEAGEAGFIEALNNLILEAGMSADQVNAMLSGMGFTTNFATEPQAIQKEGPPLITTTHSRTISGYDKYGNPTDWVDNETSTVTPGPVETYTEDAPAMITSEPGTTVVPKINSLTKKASGGANNYSHSNSGGGSPGKSSGGGGGSSSAPKYNEEKYKNTNDEKERYHVIKN